MRKANCDENSSLIENGLGIACTVPRRKVAKICALVGIWFWSLIFLYSYKDIFKNSQILHIHVKEFMVPIGVFENPHFNLPESYINKSKNQPSKYNATCARYPTIHDIEFSNIYWQILSTPNGSYQLFGAYFDDRPSPKTVRILLMRQKYARNFTLFCQLWYKDNPKPKIVESTNPYYIWQRAWGTGAKFEPYIFNCPLPNETSQEIPISVSLVENGCDSAFNNLNILYHKPDEEKEGFAVCVKGLDEYHRDQSTRLAEWIELLHILGAHKIHFYILQVHPNVMKLLAHYENEGMVTLTRLTLPGGMPNVEQVQHVFLTKQSGNIWKTEVIPYNDCFYKHMYEYKYISLLDTDEVIVPVNYSSWPSLMTDVENSVRTEKREPDSYYFRNVYFLNELLEKPGRQKFQDIPQYMHMLQHVYRSVNFTAKTSFIKCFHSTKSVVSLHNHFPFHCLKGGCKSHYVSAKMAKLHHYRKGCVADFSKKTCEDRFIKHDIMDTKIWEYKDELIERVTATLELLNLLPNDNSTII